MKIVIISVLLLGLFCCIATSYDTSLCNNNVWDQGDGEECDPSADNWRESTGTNFGDNAASLYPCCNATCQWVRDSVPCRFPAGECDLAEFCAVGNAFCPTDVKKSASTTCGTVTGLCDEQDYCDGSSDTCTDKIKTAGTVVQNYLSNPTLYPCTTSDLYCTGSSKTPTFDAKNSTVQCSAETTCRFATFCNTNPLALSAQCPSFTRKSTTTVCRNSTGDCDTVEYCNTAGNCPADTYASSSTVCRAAAGTCDAVEYCTGSSANCGADLKVSSSTTCRTATGACDVAETCDGVNNDCPTDNVRPSTYTCRGSAGSCDIVEMCDGTSKSCPADAVYANGTVCRGSAGACDVVETCDGSSTACPADSFQSAGYECRASAGLCDVAETCAGGTASCPADTYATSSVTCRAAAGACDVAEVCPGNSPNCPTDTKQPSTYVCRASDGTACSTAEYCDGSSDTCPPDTHAPSTTVCRAVTPGDDCDVAEYCTGSSSVCPTDSVQSSGYVCRAQNGQCDSQEVCDGSSKTCPADTYQTGTVCRAQNGACDVAETCPGNSPSCPSDGFRSSGYECRAAAGECDVAEQCTGSSASCPADAKQSNTYVCRAGNGALPCNKPETCDGVTNSCPADTHLSGTLCRSVTPGDDCDIAEYCDGSSASCPTDMVYDSTHQCRGTNGICDQAEYCSGGKQCPSDSYQSGTLCRAASGECDVDDYCDGTGVSCPSDDTDADLCAEGYTCDAATNKNCWAYCVDAPRKFDNATDCGSGQFINCPSTHPILISGVCYSISDYENNFYGSGFEIAIPVAQSNELDLCDGGAKVLLPANSAPPTGVSTTTASLYLRCLDAGDFDGSIVTDSVFELTILNAAGTQFNSPVTLFFPKWKPVITVWDLMNKCLAYLNTNENRWMCVDYALAISGNYVTGVTTHNSQYAIVDVCDGRGEMVLENTMCSCYSGNTWTNADRLDCTTAADPSCLRVLAERLNTSAEENSVVDSLTFTGNQMHLAVSGTIGANRTTTTIKFAGASNDECHYPSNRWDKRVDTCRDTFTLDLDWQYNVECGFNRDDTDPTYLVYTAELHVTALDLVGKLHGIPAVRNITNILNIELRFLKKVDVSTTIEVFGQIPVQAGISEQRYDPNTGRAYLSIRTRALFPFMLMTPTVTLPDASYSLVSATEIASDCSPAWGSRCDQTWQVVFTPGANCNLNGQYSIEFDAGCTNATVCPVDADSIDSATIVATVVSENFCAERVSDVSIYGKLESFKDAAYSEPIMGYLQNRTAYFMASVASHNITIMSAQVTDVTVYDDETVSAILFSASANTASGTMYSFATTPGSNTATFSFTLHPDLVPVPRFKRKWFNVRATVKVGFQNEKREIQEVVQEFDFMDGYTSTRLIGAMEIESTSTSTRDELPTPQPGMSATSKGLIAGITVAGSLTIVVVVAVFFLYRKRNTVSYSTVN